MASRYSVIFVVLTMVFLCQGAIDPPLACPEGFSAVGDGCYSLEKIKQLRWEDALTECIKRGGYLLQLESRAELAFFTYHLLLEHSDCSDWRDPGGRAWIGAIESGWDNNWTWVGNSQSVTPTNWYAGQPNDDRVGDVINMMCDNQYDWFDNFPDLELNFICEANPL